MTNRTKPTKPYSDFPLYAHNNGQWAKKIKGKTHFFGVWTDWQQALQNYLDQKDVLRLPAHQRAKTESNLTQNGVTVADLCNSFLNFKNRMVESNELSYRTWQDYYRVSKLIVEYFGKGRSIETISTDDFSLFRSELAKSRGAVALGNVVRLTRIVFRHAHESRMVQHPIYFGPGFKEPSKATKRRERQSKPKRMFTAEQIRMILKASSGPMNAMVLLGINAGLGNTDCSSLPAKLPLDGSFLEFPRPKTAIERIGWLWPETLASLEKVGPQHHETYFRTKYGNALVRSREGGANIDNVSSMLRKVLAKIGIERKGLNFYALRHTFETIAGGSRDQVAVDCVMGHIDSSMAGEYREEIGRDRIQAVCEHVRDWLFETT